MYTNTINCFYCQMQLQLQPGDSAVYCPCCRFYTHADPPALSYHAPPDNLSPPPYNFNHAPPSHYTSLFQYNYNQAPPSHYPFISQNNHPPPSHHTYSLSQYNHNHAPLSHYYPSPTPYRYSLNYPPPLHYPSPSPYNHAPPGPPPNPYGPKRAVIVGISYRNSRHEIKECYYFAECMRSLLINKFDFPNSSIIMLTEEEHPHGHKFPIKKNIKKALSWLVQGCQPNDSLVFYFCGQGSQQKDYNGDEMDGYDETLYPLDFETEGVIVDDEINEIIVRPLPARVRLHALIDASHSGTVLDLPFLCKMNRHGKYNWSYNSRVWKGSSGGEVICFSGCDDNEAYDNKAEQSKMKSTGAMTICFILAIEQGQGGTYGSILKAMRNIIKNAGKEEGGITGEHVAHTITISGTTGILLTAGLDGGILGGILGSVLAILASTSALLVSEIKKILRGMKQKAQLTASETFDLDRKRFLL